MKRGLSMSRMLALYTGPWTDLPLETVAGKASEWGYQALDIACWGEHLAVQKALAEPEYCRSILSMMEQHELSIISLSNHPVGQAVADRLDARHQASLPEWVWGDGEPEGVAVRAAQEMIDTARAAQQLGVNLVVGSTGSPFTSMHFNTPSTSSTIIDECWQRFSAAWKQVLDAMNQLGCRFACEIGPAQTAFDLISAEQTVEALGGHSSLGFSLAPSCLHWQGVDPSEFVRQHTERLWHVLVQDAAIALNGRSSLLGSFLPDGDPRRGWNQRALGMGNIDWAAIVRTLHQVHYTGPLTVALRDHDVDRDYASAQAVDLLRRLDFDPVQRDNGLFG
jgi:sugar phosphate isomerase/epimerase